MNTRQRAVGLAGVLVFIGLGLFPPWVCYFNGGPVLAGGQHYEPSARPIGHHLIFTPPASKDPEYFQSLFDGAELTDPRFYEFRIDVARLIVLWVCAVIATVAVLTLLRGRT